MDTVHAPPLTAPETIDRLPRRDAPYWNILEYCRHIGVHRHPRLGDFWVARIRNKSGGYYQKRLGLVDFTNKLGMNYDDAVEAARAWFRQPSIMAVASDPYPVGSTRELRYAKTVDGFTVGDAMRDYVEWKRVAATRSHFETNLSLINCHIIPRLGNVLACELTGRLVTAFVVDILETPPRYGRQKPRPRRQLADLDPDALRKRKKTVNTVLSILRVALCMAWENGEIESERAWRCIRRLPHKDAPRHIVLSREQCRRLIDCCREDLGTLVKAALYTGCRVSELAAMQVKDFEPALRCIYVAPGKSGRGRYVQLPHEGLAFFQAKCGTRVADDVLFRMDSGRTWRGNHKHLFRHAVDAAGIDKRFVFHGLRHTYASQLVQQGMPLAIVARQLGHANTDTVSQTYGHLSCECVDQEIERCFMPLSLEGVEAVFRTRRNRIAQPTSDKPQEAAISWPRSNQARAGGEIVNMIRGR